VGRNEEIHWESESKRLYIIAEARRASLDKNDPVIE
jgi:hypothetical protein